MCVCLIYGHLTKPCRIYVHFVAFNVALQHAFVGSVDAFNSKRVKWKKERERNKERKEGNVLSGQAAFF